MSGKSTSQCVAASLIGAVTGATLVVGWIVSLGPQAQLTLDPDVRWYHGVWPGGLIGAPIGLCVWILLTPRRVHPLITAFAGGIVAASTCTPLHFWYWSMDAPSNGGGLGPAMHAVGVGQMYFFVVLPASAVLGVVAGLFWGIRRNSRHDDQSSPT